MERTDNCKLKLNRMNKTLNHEESDRIPISDFFWTSFLERWHKELGVPNDIDIYTYYDLDYIIFGPNMDPHIKTFEVLKDNEEETVVKTGFEATIRKKYDCPMPEYVDFDTNTIEKMEKFEFDDPWDERRFFKEGDNQLGIGDYLQRNLPAFVDSVKEKYPDIPVYGSVCEGHEYLWRVIGTNNVLLWAGLYPDELGKFIRRIHHFVVELTKAQIKAADGMLAGMYIWGDVAYDKDLFFNPEFWREYFKPCVKEIVDVCHSNGIPVVYHGDGNIKKILEDFIETGIDAYNPLEAKAGLDVIELRREYGHRFGFCGNMNVMEWSSQSKDELNATVLRKLNAGKGGGYIFQSDHSIPSNISGENYEYVVNLVRKYGKYPLNLGKYDIKDL
jgi:uroporphyrinogen decarboxylase